MVETITIQDFENIELRAGTIIKVEDFPEAKKPGYKITADFGEFGIKKSSVQITKHYTKKELIGKQIIGVINLPAKQITNFQSEFLTTGFKDENGDIILAKPERPLPRGAKMC
jgi:tRNA-binding protein